jgi:hypothetical protein
MRVIIAGSRGFNDYDLLKEKCDYFFQNYKDIEIISGTANGADKLGERYAIENGYQLKLFPADWNRYGNSAGFRRNVEMSNHADALVVFWDGKSRGTQHMIREAKNKKLLLRVVEYTTL